MEQTEVVSRLLEANLELTKQVVELSKALSQAQAPASPVQMELSRDPLWMPESEEDALHALNNGLINKSEYEDVLKEIGFFNSEITVPSPL